MSDYELTGTKWGAAEAGSAGGEVFWSLAESAGRYLNFDSYIDEGGVADVIARAFHAWESVADIDFRKVADSASSDIRLGLASIDGAYGTIGSASWSYAPRSGDFNATHAAEIAFDREENWSLVSRPAADEVDLYATAVHEIGHAIGLSHSPASDTIMYYAQQPEALTLSWDDVAGARAIYGPPSGDASAATRIVGTDENDRLEYVPGAGEVSGGAGFDTLVVPGNQVDYGHDIDAGRHVILSSRLTGDVTFLDGVERLRFDDGQARLRPDADVPVLASQAAPQGTELASRVGIGEAAPWETAPAAAPAATDPGPPEAATSVPAGIDDGIWPA